MVTVHMLRRPGRLNVSTRTPWSSTSYRTVVAPAAVSVIERRPELAGRGRLDVLAGRELRGTLLDERGNSFCRVGLATHPSEQLPLTVERRLPVGLGEHLVSEPLGQADRGRSGLSGDLVRECEGGGEYVVRRHGSGGDAQLLGLGAAEQPPGQQQLEGDGETNQPGQQ